MRMAQPHGAICVSLGTHLDEVDTSTHAARIAMAQGMTPWIHSWIRISRVVDDAD